MVCYGRRENASASLQTLDPVLIWGLIELDGEVSVLIQLKFQEFLGSAPLAVAKLNCLRNMHLIFRRCS